MRIALLVLMVAIAAGAAGYFAANSRIDPAPAAAAAQVSADPIFSAAIPDLNGQPQSFSQWRGKVLIVNFWATWCAPCLKEIPEFIELQEQYGKRGLQFVGIAVDQKDKVATYAQKTGINYPVLLGEAEAIDLSRKAGNRLGALPYTLIIDRQGQVVATELGGLTQAKLKPQIEALL